MSDQIVVVDYDPGWPDAFAAEHARIATALGERALAIEHYGSTAVAGIAAKPIIDVMVVVRDLEPPTRRSRCSRTPGTSGDRPAISSIRAGSSSSAMTASAVRRISH
jgi:GrpB protein